VPPLIPEGLVVYPPAWVWIVGGILACAIGSVVSVRQQRHSMERDLVPRKRRLEALKELDAP